jgi:lipopolysaccharide export LptBFGC system permease protein LptF
MSEKNYLLISATIFALFAFLHLVRLFTHWSVQIGAVTFPLWGSWLVLLIAAALSVWAFRLMSQWKSSHQ